MNFIDSHAHINDEAFNEDRDQVISRVFESGTYKFVEIALKYGISTKGVYKNHNYAIKKLKKRHGKELQKLY